MAVFNISGLVNNIVASIKNIGAPFGFGDESKDALYPEIPNVAPKITKEQKTNWNNLPNPYAFAVVSEIQNSLNSIGDAGSRKSISGGGFKDFQLPLAPQEITQTEIPATVIRPTQGGTVITHSGIRYKKLVIKGTTGIAPFRGAGGVDKSTGEAIFQPNELKYKSGYEVFLSLRNYFRSYYTIKKNRDNEDLRLIWKNFKDGEFLIVELDGEGFTMQRSATKSFLYDYTIELKVLGHFEPIEKSKDKSFLEDLDNTLNDAMNKIDAARGVFLRSRDIIKQVESTYESVLLEPLRKITLALRAFNGAVNTLADFPKNIITTTVSAGAALAVLLGIDSKFEAAKVDGTDDPVLQDVELPTDLEAAVARKGAAALFDLDEAMTLVDSSELPEKSRIALENEILDAQNLPRSFYEDLVTDINRMKANAEDFFNLGSTGYDAIFDRTATATADVTKVITNDELDVLSAFNDALEGIIAVMSTNELFKSDFADQIQVISDDFNGEVPLKSTEAVIQIELPAKTDLERLAFEYLGDSNRWPEIAELNGLDAPYINQDITDTTPNVAKPGNKILIPASLTVGFGTAPVGKEIPATTGLSHLEKNLGVDFKLTKDFDLALGNGGDLLVTAGTDNMAQAIVLKILIEKGDLIRNPQIGNNVIIGGKKPSLTMIRNNLVSTLTQDQRVERLTDVSLYEQGPETRMNFKVKLKQFDLPVPVSIKV